MNAPRRRGLTLVEMLAALALLSLVAGACVSWITSVSRGSLPVLNARLDSCDLDHAVLLIEELRLRSTDGRLARLDQQGRLLVPTRWWASMSSGELELASWARVEHDEVQDALVLHFMDNRQQPLARPRVVATECTGVTTERVGLPDHSGQIRLSIALASSETRVILLQAEELP